MEEPELFVLGFDEMSILHQLPLSPSAEGGNAQQILGFSIKTEEFLEGLTLIGRCTDSIRKTAPELRKPLVSYGEPLLLEEPGSALNRVLEVIGSRFCDDRVLLELDWTEVKECAKHLEDAEAVSLCNLWQVLNELLGRNPIGRNVSPITQKRLASYLEQTIPHTPTETPPVNWFTSIVGDLSSRGGEVHPIHCLMDVVFHSLMAFAVDEKHRRSTLEVCPICNRVFYAGHGNTEYCYFGGDSSLCSRKMKLERGKRSRRNCRLHDLINKIIIENGGDTREARKEAASFRNNVKKEKESFKYLPPLDRYDKVYDFLLNEQKRYESLFKEGFLQ